MQPYVQDDTQEFASRINAFEEPLTGKLSEQGEKLVFIRQVKDIYHNATIPLFATVINSALVAGVFSWVTDPTLPLVWAGLLWALSFWRLLEISRFKLEQDIDFETASKWRTRFELEMLCIGLLWGGSVFLLGSDIGLAHTVFIAFVLAGMSAGAVAAFSAVPRVAYAYIVPALVPMGAGLLLAGEPLHMAMSLMITIYLAAMILLVQRSHYSLARAQRLRYQNSCLLDYYRTTSKSLESLYDSLQSESDSARQSLRELRVRDQQVKDLLASIPVLMLAINETGRVMAVEGQHELSGTHVLRLGDNFSERVAQIPGAQKLLERAFKGEPASAIVPLDHNSVEMHVWPSRTDDAKGSVTVIMMDVSREQEIERKKRQFVNAMSHELRTPLTSVYGAVKLLVEGGLQGKPADTRSLATIALRSCEKLMRVSEDAILLAETGREKRRNSFKAIDVMPIVHAVTTKFTSDAASKNMNIAVRQTSASTFANTEEKLLRHAIEAVVSNGIKFSPAGGELLIEVGESHLDDMHFVRIAVADSGPGIPAEKRTEVFEHFVQLSSSDNRDGYGSGLGLSIVKEAVHVMGGKVSIVDVEPQGTRVILEIPTSAG